ncbi:MULTISPECIES: ABC transporter permease [Methylobacterium]|jgi:peptide/nickel transport system permease protein|uniref:ABC transporter permease n=1 Tax=Methylobacterium TaxID=407 RepID=UPI0008E47B3B|nr:MULTISPECIES: ABC transporter permease [Methylobacterium]MBZ6416955.1 ABC transporter permease [Methylobacterium sp.]SFF07286.1 peptide/nickel transport system permease protein [Methylobacterium sp. yr596]
MTALALKMRRGWRPGSVPLLVGGILTALLIAIALTSLVWTPADPTRMRILQKLKGPLVSGLLGTDQLGRDVASMLMRGAFNSLTTAFAAVAVGAVLGTLAGVAAAANHKLDAVLMRICDALFALPPILSAIMLGALLGPGALTAIVAIGFFMIPVFARVTRGAAMQVWAREYIMAARMAGKGTARITLEHVLPNISAQVIVQVTIQLAMAILTEAGLSFLGLGLPPPAPTWGRMLAESQTYLIQAPHLALAPGLAIAAAVLGLNLLGDGLAARLDPRRRQAS